MSCEAVETLKLIWLEMKALNSKADRTNEQLDSLERKSHVWIDLSTMPFLYARTEMVRAPGT